MRRGGKKKVSTCSVQMKQKKEHTG